MKRLYKRARTLAEKWAEEGRKQGYEEALQEARTLAEKLVEEGRKQEHEENMQRVKKIALGLLAKGVSLTEVAEITQLSLSELKILCKQQL